MLQALIRRTIEPKWKCSRGGYDLVQVQNGLDDLQKLFGVEEMEESRITDYVVYQVYRMRDAIADGRWRQGWLFSIASMDKFRRQFLTANGKSGINYYINLWLEEAELSRPQLTKMIAKQKPNPLRSMVYMESEEPIKKRFLNTAVGLALCQQSTTGWSPLSLTCGRCDNWIECGKMTAKKYPELMRFRKEIYNGDNKEE